MIPGFFIWNRAGQPQTVGAAFDQLDEIVAARGQPVIFGQFCRLEKRRQGAHIRGMVRSFEDITTAELESLRSLKDGSKWEVPPHHKARLVEAGYIKDAGGYDELTKAAIDRVARGK
jgi:hypothetical protein